MNEKDIVLRPSEKRDEPELKKLWHDVFGDGPEYIDRFFTNVYEPGMAVVVQAGDSLASAVYMMPIGNLVLPDGSSMPASVSYAFATFPEFRSRGYGGKAAEEAVLRSHAEGLYAATICPAEDSLFSYYAERTGYSDWFYVNEKTVAPSNTPARLYRTDASDYERRREQILGDRAHIEFSEKFMRYQQELCISSGGGLYLFETQDEFGCCCAETDGKGGLFIKELLCEDTDPEKTAPDVAAALGAGPALVRYPAESGEGRRFAMLRFPEWMPKPQSVKPAWYGFAFD